MKFHFLTWLSEMVRYAEKRLLMLIPRMTGVIYFAVIFVTNLVTVLFFIVSPLLLYLDAF